MEEGKIREVVSEFANFYNLGSLYPRELRHLLEDRCDDAEIVNKLLSYVKERNGKPSTFCYGINDSEIFNRVLNISR